MPSHPIYEDESTLASIYIQLLNERINCLMRFFKP
jgi:hypothetical protein